MFKIKKINPIEVKSGKDWGFPEIFKVKGWMSYLGFQQASFIVQITHNKNLEFYHRIAQQLNINLINTPIIDEALDDTDLKAQYSISSSEHHKNAVSCLRFSFALEHKLTDDIISTCKSNNEIQSYLDLRKYLGIINDSSFFESEPKNRIKSIFSAYQQYRNITARIDQEKLGKPYISLTNDEKIDTKTYASLFYYCQSPDIRYASLYVELLEKLHILKYCVEDLLRPTGQESLFSHLGDELLPPAMRDGIKKLNAKPYYYLYPYFWQVFIFLFGGFILNNKNYKPQEYALLSEMTGITLEHIDDAFEAFDLLFPLSEGKKWLFNLEKSEITMLLFMPVPLCGIGSNFRLCIYTKDEQYTSFKALLPGDKTYNDIVKWNNLAAKYLLKSKDVNKNQNNNE